MVEIIISEEQRKRAQELYEFKVLNNSIEKGKGNIYGAIGEVITADYFRGRKSSVDTKATYDYDLIVDGYKIDVKTTKVGVNVTPLPYYAAKVCNFNTGQKCDFYLFVDALDDLSKCWLCGYISKEKYYQIADFRKKGEKERSFTYRATCYTTRIDNLNPLF